MSQILHLKRATCYVLLRKYSFHTAIKKVDCPLSHRNTTIYCL